MVPGLEYVAGYLVAWAMRTVGRIGAKADSAVDQVLDAGLERLHRLIAARLGDDPTLAQLEREAPTGEVSERTQRRVEDAVAQAADDDSAFAADLGRILDQLAQARGAGGGLGASGTGSVTQSRVKGVAVANTGVIGGDVEARSSDG
jgi:hypothetical protein